MNTEAPQNLKLVPGYGDKYEASPEGKIFNVKTGHELRPNRNNKNHYCRVRLSRCSKSQEYVHIMVAKAYLPNPENKPQVNHKNGDKSDNRVKNLEWVTREENMQHAFEHGLYSWWRVHPSQKAEIVRLVEQGVPKHVVAAQYGLKLGGLESLLRRYKRAETLALAA